MVNPNGITPEIVRAAQGASAAMRNSDVDLGRGLDRAVRKAERLTDENYHTEALKAFTDYFGYNDLSNHLTGISREHRAAGSLTAVLLNRRNLIMDELFSRVRRDYGVPVLNKVYRGL